MLRSFLRQEVKESIKENSGEIVLTGLYSAVVLQERALKDIEGDFLYVIEKIFEIFTNKIQEDASVETVAEILFLSYFEIAALLKEKTSGINGRYSMKVPFNRILRPELYFSVFEK